MSEYTAVAAVILLDQFMLQYYRWLTYRSTCSYLPPIILIALLNTSFFKLIFFYIIYIIIYSPATVIGEARHLTIQF